MENDPKLLPSCINHAYLSDRLECEYFCRCTHTTPAWCDTFLCGVCCLLSLPRRNSVYVAFHSSRVSKNKSAFLWTIEKCAYLALNSDRSISLIRLLVCSVCVCSIVSVAYVWNGNAHLSLSLYINSCRGEWIENKKETCSKYQWPIGMRVSNLINSLNQRLRTRQIFCVFA